MIVVTTWCHNEFVAGVILFDPEARVLNKYVKGGSFSSAAGLRKRQLVQCEID